ISIIYGSSNLYKQGQKFVWAGKVIIFPRYRNKTRQNNIALIKTKTNMTLDGQESKAIELPRVVYEPPIGQNVLVSGYGDVDEKPIKKPIEDPSKYDLKAANFTVKNRSECKLKYSDKYTENETFCAQGCSGVYIERGDIGDPAVQKNETKIDVLAGLVSYADLAMKNSLTIFIKVGSYVFWIQDVMKNKTKS
ncbi:Sar s 3 allergen (serine protease-like protein 18), partial [Sarcoptes scabiei]